MKLLEHIDSILSEAARWKDGGSKQTPIDVIRQHAGDQDVMIHFSDVEGKLGINPSSDFNIATPAGIYAFPLVKEIADSILKGQNLGTFSSRDWAYVFRAKGDVFHISKRGDAPGYGDSQLARHKTALRRQYASRLTNDFDDVWADSSPFPGPKHDTPFYRLWTGTRNIAVALKGGRYSSQSSVLWTKILMSIGIDGVVDHGSSTVHAMEPTQAVIFSSGSAQLLSMIENPISYVDKKGHATAEATGFDLSKSLSMEPERAKGLMVAMWTKYRNQDAFDDALLDLEELLDSSRTAGDVLRGASTSRTSEMAVEAKEIYMRKVEIAGANFKPDGVQWSIEFSTLKDCSIDLRNGDYLETREVTLEGCTVTADEGRMTKAFSKRAGRDMDLGDVFDVLREHPEATGLLGIDARKGSSFEIKVGPKSVNVQV